MPLPNQLAKALAAARSHEWWGYKLPPLLAIGYATALKNGASLLQVGPWLLLSLAAVAIGAVYVSLINDITDIEEDRACGKHNRMAGVAPGLRWIFPVLCLLAGAAFIFFLLLPDTLSALLYTLPWISFSLYSLPPFRFKTRGFWGVMADAGGSHLFISLFMVARISQVAGRPVDWLWFGAVGAWALLHGLRGILWHQFHDRNHDLQSGTRTFACRIDPAAFRKPSLLLMALEAVALVLLLYCIDLPLPEVFLLAYIVLALVRQKKMRQTVVALLSPASGPYQIFLLEYYSLFLPLALLASAVVVHTTDWRVGALHLLLFPQQALLVLRDLAQLAKRSGHRLLSLAKARPH
ncbi:UbiA family prenyltransferase [Paraflavisolibacter sp. H34]|uniref:UbiA family prenyltransferase n=1 Tax=Huijunlia imazamoxiresistens TaxID=3127457 RepID=UPI0030170919